MAASTLHNAAAGRTGAPLDHAGVTLRPAFHEQGLLGELFLGVEDNDFRLRLVRFEVEGDQAGALIGAGRAAERIGRRRNDHGAAIGHGFELLAQQGGLRSRLPSVRHGLRCLLVVPFQGAPQQLDARRYHQTVVRQIAAVLQRHLALCRVNTARGIVDDGHPVTAAQPVVAVGDEVHAGQAAQNRIAERAGHEMGTALDKGHLNARVGAPQVFRAGGAAETAADHHHPAGGRPAEGRKPRHACRRESAGTPDQLHETSTCNGRHRSPLLFVPQVLCDGGDFVVVIAFGDAVHHRALADVGPEFVHAPGDVAGGLAGQ